MAMIAITGDDLIAGFDRGLHTDDNRFLTNVEMAEATDEAHAVKLPRTLLEAAYQQHCAIITEHFLGGCGRFRRACTCRWAFGHKNKLRPIRAPRPCPYHGVFAFVFCANSKTVSFAPA